MHYGHLRPALEAQQALGLASVRLLPCRLPPHRARPGRDAGQRLDLLRLGAREVPGFRVDDRELHRSGPSYTVDTLRHLRQEQGSARPLVLLMGADSLAGLGRWHRWRELFDYAHVVVLDRPGHASQPDGEVAAEVAGRWLDGPGALRDAPPAVSTGCRSPRWRSPPPASAGCWPRAGRCGFCSPRRCAAISISKACTVIRRCEDCIA